MLLIAQLGMFLHKKAGKVVMIVIQYVFAKQSMEVL